MNEDQKNKINKKILVGLMAMWIIAGAAILQIRNAAERPFASTFPTISALETKFPQLPLKHADWYLVMQELPSAQTPLDAATQKLLTESATKLKPTTREELLAILCHFNQWPQNPSAKKLFTDIGLKDALTPCLAYAQEKHFLDSLQLKKTFLRKKPVKRMEAAAIVKAVYGIETEALHGAAEEPTSTATPKADVSLPAEPAEEDVAPFTAVAPKMFEANFFENVVLKQPFPNTFYRHEAYFFEGDAVASTAEKAFVFLMKDDVVVKNFIAPMKNGKFRIPVFFPSAGNFKIGLILGSSGRSKIADISVLANPGPSGVRHDDPSPPDAPAFQYSAGTSTVSWNTPGGGNITRVKFLQTGRKAEFLFRSSLSSFEPFGDELEKLAPGKGFIIVENAFAITDNGTIDLTSNWVASASTTATFAEKSFRTLEKSVAVDQLTDVLTAPGTFLFKGSSQKTVQVKAYYTAPNGFVHAVVLKNGSEPTTIPANTAFSASVNFSAPGSYIFEINDPDGSAVVNVPVYVGSDILPLIPDYTNFDTTTSALDPATPLNLDDARTGLLALINQTRKKAGLRAVKADDEKMNLLAQNHSEDMVRRNFFGHNNPDKKTPEDRRKAMKIATAVRENLAKAPTLNYSHQGLLRSPIHRKNVLEPAWTRVGLGIAKNSEGYLLVTEEFSADPLTQADVDGMKSEFTSAVQEVRQRSSLANFTPDGALENVAQDWSLGIVAEHFFDFKKANGESLLDNARKAGAKNTLQAFIIQGGDKEKITEELLNQPPVKNGEFVGIGMGLAGDFDIGLITVTVFYEK